MNPTQLHYQYFEDGQEQLLSDLIWQVFLAFEAPDYSEEGIQTFKQFIEPERLKEELSTNRLKAYCCYNNDELVGVLALRDITHISLLFVKESEHRKGIAKELLRICMREIHAMKGEHRQMTVNSSPYAVEIYKKMGFRPTDLMMEREGIIYMPMVMEI